MTISLFESDRWKSLRAEFTDVVEPIEEVLIAQAEQIQAIRRLAYVVIGVSVAIGVIAGVLMGGIYTITSNDGRVAHRLNTITGAVVLCVPKSENNVYRVFCN